MLTYTLDERGGLPLYEYLYRRVRPPWGTKPWGPCPGSFGTGSGRTF